MVQNLINYEMTVGESIATIRSTVHCVVVDENDLESSLIFTQNISALAQIS